MTELTRERINLFIKTLVSDRVTPQQNGGATSAASCLVRKVVSVLESQEKLPLLVHDPPGGPPNLQVTAGLRLPYMAAVTYVHR